MAKPKIQDHRRKHCMLRLLTSELVGKTDWLINFQSLSGVYLASETSATAQHIRTEAKLLSKEDFYLYHSHPVRPKSLH